MNWGRGLLRLWMMATVLWLLVIGAFAVEPAQTFWTFWSVERPHLLGPEEIGIKPQGPKPLVTFDDLSPPFDPDAYLAAAPKASVPAFDPDAYLVAEAWRRRESAKNSLLQMSGIAIGLPFAAFIFGATMLWVIRGFRPSQSTRT